MGKLFVLAALDALSFSMVLASWPAYMNSLEVSKTTVGLLGSMAALVTLIWNPIGGSIGDKLGRKTILIQSLFVGLAANILVVFSSSLVAIVLSRVLAALACQIGSLLKGLVDDTASSKEERIAAMGKMQGIFVLSMLFGSIISAVIGDLPNGYTYIYTLISIIFVVEIGLASTLPSIVIAKPAKEDKNSQKGLLNLLKNAALDIINVDWSKFWDVFITKLFMDMAFHAFGFNTTFILTKKFGLGPSYFGYTFGAMSLFGIVTMSTLGKFNKTLYGTDTSGRTRIMHGNVFLIGALCLLSIAPTYSVYVAGLIPLITGRGLVEQTLMQVLLERASPSEKGTIMGTFESIMSFSGLMTPLISSTISSLWGEEVSLLAATVPVALGMVLLRANKIKVQ